MVAIKVITAEFGVSLIALQKMEDDHQQRMGHCHQSFLAAQALGQTEELTTQIAILLYADSPGCLHQGRPQVRVAFPGAPGKAFTTSGFIAGTNARPTGQVRGVSKDSHLDANLSV